MKSTKRFPKRAVVAAAASPDGAPRITAPPLLETEALRRFVAVAAARSFTRAAATLGIAQPLLSRSVAALETQIGAVLLARNSRKVALTPAGERLLAAAGPVLQNVRELARVVAVGEVDITGAVRIGATETVTSHFLPKALALMLQRYPGLHPLVRVGPSVELTAALARQELDAVLTFNAPRDRLLLQRSIADVRFVVAIAAAGSIAASVNETFIGSREVEDEREQQFPVLQAWRKHWPNARIRISSNSSVAHIALVRAGVGVSILPAFAIAEEIAAGRIMRAPSSDSYQFPLRMIRRRGDVSRGLAAFMQTLRDALVTTADIRWL